MHIEIPADLARGGTVGRIGVAADAVRLMQQQRLLLSSAKTADDPLSPVPRMWRGLQRRAQVLLDVQRCVTLPGSDAARRGNLRDVLLVSHRQHDRRATRRSGTGEVPWGLDAQRAAELCWSIAVSEQRTVLLVEPIGRVTPAQRDFAAALCSVARAHRAPAPRSVKAGVMAALLTGDHTVSRHLLASAMPMSELHHTACAAVGDPGPWPVLSIGRQASFYEVVDSEGPMTLALSMLLALVSVLERSGQPTLARTLMQSIQVSCAAAARLRDPDPADAAQQAALFLSAIRANWGRDPNPAAVARTSGAPRASDSAIAGLRIRIESALPLHEVRERLLAAAQQAGVDMASVRRIESADGAPLYDVRVRPLLGQLELPASTVVLLTQLQAAPMQCRLVEPWSASRLTRPAPIELTPVESVPAPVGYANSR